MAFNLGSFQPEEDLEQEKTFTKAQPSYNFDDLGQSDLFQLGLETESFTYMGASKIWETATDLVGSNDAKNYKDDEWDLLKDEEFQQELSYLSPSAFNIFQDYGAQNPIYAREALKAAQEHDRKMAYMESEGGLGTAYRFLGALSDLPLTLVTMPETFGGSGAAWLVRLERVLNSSFARRALTGGTIEGLMEVGRRQMSPEERSEFTLLLSVGLGGLFRGAFGRTPDQELVRQSEKIIKRASKGLDITKGLKNITKRINTSRSEVADEVVKKMQYDLATLTSRTQSQTFKGLADKLFYFRVGEEAIERGAGDVALEEVKDALEVSLNNMITQATRPIMTDLAKLAKRGVFKTMRAHWNPAFQKTINEVMADLQINKLISPNTSVDELLEGAAKRLQTEFNITADQAMDAAKKMLKASEDVAEKSHDILAKFGSESFVGIKGAAPAIPKNKNYIPLVYDSHKLINLIREYGQDEVKLFLKKAIESAVLKRGGTVNEGTTKGIVTALLRKMSNTDDLSFLTKMNKDTIEDIMKAEGDNIFTPQEIEYVASLFGKSKTVKGAPGASKYEKTRGLFDYETVHTLKDGRTISFKDILSNDFEAVWFPYARTQAGFNTLEKLGIKDATSLRKVRTKIQDELRAAKVDEDTITKELSTFDEIVRELQGKPLTDINPFGKGAQSLRILKNMNIARYLGGTFYTMTAELGSTVWNTGVVHMFKSLPMMRQLLKQFRTGKFDNDLMEEIYTHLQLMGDLNRGIGFSKFEHDFAHVPLVGSSTERLQKALNKAEVVSDQFREATLMAGGIKPLTAWFEASAASGIITKMMKAATTGKIPRGFETTLKEMGFSGKLREKIFAEMRKHTEYVNTPFGKNLRKVNFEKMDREVYNAMTMGIKRMVNTIVQRSTLGDKVGITFGKSLVQNTVLGKLGLEMKGYVLNAWSKQLGRALTRRDLYTLGMLTTQMALGALGYMAQTHVNYMFDAKKRKELLTPENIAKVSFARSSMASWLPQIIDTGADLTKMYDPQFSQARSSGLGQNLIGGMPIVDTLNSLSNMANIPKAALGGDVTPGELKSGLRALPFHNMIGFRTLMESVVANQKEKRANKRKFEKYQF